MYLDANCIECLVRRESVNALAQNDPENAYLYMRDVLQLLLDAPEGVAAPYMIPQFNDAFAKYWGTEDRYEDIKRKSNDFMLKKLPLMRSIIAQSDDPLKMALKFSQTGNYIDFGPLAGRVCDEELDAMLLKTPENPLDETAYRRFADQLATAKRFVCMGDNAGEIVADVALMEVLRAQLPNLELTYVVRGGPVLNDVTREDAKAVGIDKLCRVIDNGTRISGTQLAYISDELRRTLDEADVILSKGQANFETMCPCDYNVYFMFLCKCARFEKLFGVPRLTGMFLPMQTMGQVPFR